MKTELEIERRFLLKRLPILEDNNHYELDVKQTYDEEFYITQHYISSKNGSKTKRVRHVIDKRNDTAKFIYTEKTYVSPITSNESEKEIKLEKYYKLVEKSKRVVFKHRYVYYITDKMKWEIDVLDHESGLIIAEIELPSEDFDLKIPDFIQKEIIYEISGIKEFSNSSLAIEE